jgi:Immunity protein 21
MQQNAFSLGRTQGASVQLAAFTWYESLGGPSVLISAADLHAWGGIDRPEPHSDAERAGTVSGYAGILDVDGARAIVLGDAPHAMTFHEDVDTDDIFVLRWVVAPNEQAIVDALPALSRRESWELSVGEWPVLGGALYLIDSVDCGTGLTYPHLSIPLMEGWYRLSTAEWQPSTGTELVVHRISRVVHSA